MSLTIQQHWFTEHRGWEDIASILLGLLVVAAPVAFMSEPVNYIYMNSAVVGFLIISLGFLQFLWLQRWEEHLELLCGLWVISSPYLFGYGGQLAAAHYVLGILVAGLAAFELWQDKDRDYTA